MITAKEFRRQIVAAARAGEAVPPICPHAPPAGQCGGCTFQDRPYPAQLAAKRAALHALWAGDLAPAAPGPIEVVGSPQPLGYRTRMDYVASKDRFGLRRGGKFNYIVELQECHLVPPHAFEAARAAYERATALGLPDYNLKTHVGFLRYIVVRRSPDDELLLAAVTAAPDPEGRHAAALEQIADAALADPRVVGFHWLVNDTRTDISFGAPLRHWDAARLPMRVGRHRLQIGPNTFFQNNVFLLEPLLDDVRAAAADDGQRPTVADLYGGVGTIALHLAERAARVVCVESVAESADLAAENAAAGGAANVTAVAADVLAYLREQPVGAFEVAVADPPRTGLGPDVCAELLRIAPRRLVYVSCNPLTQLDDVRALAAGYRLTALRGYDMFPQTPHLEALAVLERRSG